MLLGNFARTQYFQIYSVFITKLERYLKSRVASCSKFYCMSCNIIVVRIVRLIHCNNILITFSIFYYYIRSFIAISAKYRQTIRLKVSLYKFLCLSKSLCDAQYFPTSFYFNKNSTCSTSFFNKYATVCII